MSELKVNTITNAAGGNTAQINGMTPTADSLQGFRNRIINGNMVIDQRNAGALVAGATGTIYAVDRTLIGVFGGGSGRISGQRSTTVPSSAGFVNSLIATVTTADASPGTESGYCIRQQIEGFNVADLRFGTASASAITLSFWVRSSIAGTYAVVFQNADVSRAYAATYTINSANTFELKTITIPGDTAGTWDTTNGVGLSALWCLGGGTNRQAPAPTVGAWGAGIVNTITDVAGCVDWIATSGATFYITGVQLEAGSVATPFERRPFGTELALCERYYHSNGGATSYVAQSTAYNAYVFPQKMRTAPSVTLTPSQGSVNTGTISNAGFNSVGTTVVTGVAVIASAEL
jgi:hypothetical protein